MDYWKSKVLPKMRLILVKTGGKKAAAAAELVKSFDGAKEGINGEFEQKAADIQPKVVEIYESVPAPVKILIKERKKTSAIKKNSAAITKLFEDLAKIEFPGAKQVSEGIAKVGPALLSGPIFATFEKVSTLLPVAAEDQSSKEAPAATEEKKDDAAAAAGEKKEDEAAVAEEKKEEATGEKKEEATEEKKEEATTAAAETAPAAAEPAAEETSAAVPAEAAPEAAATAEPESAPAKAEETPKAA